jgi:Fe2+ or Zn2+ uptake regulation protein
MSHHHHLVCRACGRIVDIHADYQLDLPEQASQEFEVVATHVEFIGRCRPCGGAAAPLSNTIDGGRR